MILETLYEQIPATAISLLILIVVFVPMERVFPAKSGQAFFRPQFWLDMTYFAGQYLLWNTLVFACLVWGRDQLDPLMPSAFRTAVAAQPLWLQMIEVVLLSDFCIYWAHRLQHRVGFLWRFHRVHHSAEHMDWLAAHREHPLDTIYTVSIINLPGFILGFPLEVMAGFIAFRGLWAIYIHSNVRLSLGPLRVLIGSPELHHWHHDKARDAGNYANLSPIMDKIFGTYTCPDHEPEAFGLAEKFPRTYLGQLLQMRLKWFKSDNEKI